MSLRTGNRIPGIASAVALAILVVSCSGKISQVDAVDLKTLPMQSLDDMFAIQTKNGKVEMRMQADVMEHYETDTVSWDAFPKGLSVYFYNVEGKLESLILSDDAKHTKRKKKPIEETWAAFGNVVIHNVIKGETMETDTLYWDRDNHEIHTDCYVKMYSGGGFVQGYGMRSDERATNAVLLQPFNSYGITQRDTTVVERDTVNFIGPLPQK